MPIFDELTAWYAITIVGVSDPLQAGIKLKSGTNRDRSPIIEWLYRLTDRRGEFEEHEKFGLNGDLAAPINVAAAVFRTANWFTDNGYFDGLHMLPDCSFTFFPARHSAFGVDHTINCHAHGYGNMSKPIDATRAKRMYQGAIESFFQCEAWEYAYPDVLVSRIETEESFDTAINYIIKPFKVQHFYEDALRHGCQFESLNHDFHQVVFGCEVLFPVSAMGMKYGNMSQKSSRRYIGIPQEKEMSHLQIKRFIKKLKKGDGVQDWEIERYCRHLDALARKNEREGRKPSEG